MQSRFYENKKPLHNAKKKTSISPITTQKHLATPQLAKAPHVQDQSPVSLVFQLADVAVQLWQQIGVVKHNMENPPKLHSFQDHQIYTVYTYSIYK